MKKLRWQLFIVLLALVAITVLLLGRQPVIQAVEPEPVTGGVYTEGLVGAMGRLNPIHDVYNPADRDVTRLLYSSLVRFDSRGLPNPELAESWQLSSDGMSAGRAVSERRAFAKCAESTPQPKKCTFGCVRAFA